VKKILVRFLVWLAGKILAMRYRIKIAGMDEILKKGRTGILFLPNHPGLIDPIILMAHLYNKFGIRVLADRHQVDRFFIRNMVSLMNIIPIDDVEKTGVLAVDDIRNKVNICADVLKSGENLLVYPAGRIYRSFMEDLRGNSGAYTLIREVPQTRVVLVRTSGLWGSSFTWASGEAPSVAAAFRKGFKGALKSFIFFMPRRKVTIELFEPTDIPCDDDKTRLNRYLENFYNAAAQPNTYVPYSIWQRGGTQILPEPKFSIFTADPSLVPQHIRDEVLGYIEELTFCSRDELKDSTRLAHDLGMDSLTGMELITWLQEEYGFVPDDIEDINTVGDVMLAAAGEFVKHTAKKIKPVQKKWFTGMAEGCMPAGVRNMTIPQAFLKKAVRNPSSPIIADQVAGVKTYRDMVLGLMVLVPEFRKLDGEYLGLMMPASVTANLMYMAALFAGKIPAMVNWTLGRKNLEHCLKLVNMEKILTSRMVADRLRGQGVDLAAVESRFVYIEDIAASLGRVKKIAALVASRLCWILLRKALKNVKHTAVVLFTSGSENFPKAVPLTHKNILTNLDSVLGEAITRKLGPNDVLLGMLPPFHSFGITVCTVLPLIHGTRVAYSPNPTDGVTIAHCVNEYKITLLVGTPTFLNGIMKSSSNRQLESLQLIVTGAEKCTKKVYDLFGRRCPKAVIMEGYGVTECSPVVSVNHDNDHTAGTIGKVIGAFDFMILNPETHEELPHGQTGLLVVAGDCVFGGYMNYDGASPFLKINGREWYVTGDLVFEYRKGGWLTFAGRLKRFIKLGGEMISLPAIEAVLLEHFSKDSDDGPCLAVMASKKDEPEIIMVATRDDIGKEDANAVIRAAGMSGLHSIRVLRKMPALPLLGTGKTDYRTLAGMI